MPIETSRSVFLLGPRTLQNSLLSAFITDSGSISCRILSSLSDVRGARADHEILFLADVSDSTRYLDMLDPLRDTAKVALINTEDEDQYLYEILQRFDLRGIFLKNTNPDEFIQGIFSLFSGEYWFTPNFMANIFRRMKQEGIKNSASAEAEYSLIDRLTSKELTILRSLVGGHTNQDIADSIYLSPHTVKTHIYNIYKKIGVTNRVQAVSWAKKHLNYEF
ncbi:MAG: LuxR C-terminal-related transcriptional regulator [Gammaproteobacteria bacterium]